MPEREEPTGALVRPYAVTRGRTRPKLEIALEALVETTVRGRTVKLGRFGQGSEHQYIAAMCDGGRVQSLAEIAARMQLPLGVARVHRRRHGLGRTGRGVRADVAGRRDRCGGHGTAGEGAEWTSQALTWRVAPLRDA